MRKFVVLLASVLLISAVFTLCSCGQSVSFSELLQDVENELSSAGEESVRSEEDDYTVAINNLIDLRMKGITDHATDMMPPEAFDLWLEENGSLEEGLKMYEDIAENYREMTKDGDQLICTITGERELVGSCLEKTVDYIVSVNIDRDSIGELLEIDLFMSLADESETMTVCVAKINGKWYPLMLDGDHYEAVL